MNYTAVEGLAQALFEESGDGLFLFDPETEQLLDVNSKAQRLTGIPLRDLLHRPMTELFRFGRDPSLQKLRDAATQTGTYHSQEGYFLRTVRPDVWVPINLTVARLHVKPRTLALVTVRDIRDRWQAQAELKESHARLEELEAELRHVLAAVPDCLWVAELDESGRVAYTLFSPAVEAIAGQPAEFFLAGVQRWWGVIHPEDRGRWEAAAVRWRSSQRTQEEYRVIRPDGSCRWVRESVQGTQRSNGRRFIRLAGLIRDITDWKRTEERWRESGARVGALLDSSPVLAFLKDQQGRLVYHNAPFGRLLRTTPGDPGGKTDCDLFPAEVAGRLREADAAVLAIRQPVGTLEPVATPEGGLHRWLVLKFPVEDNAGGRAVGGLAVDVTALLPSGVPPAAGRPPGRGQVDLR
jgi:PAS domain S-box-containing protein